MQIVPGMDVPILLIGVVVLGIILIAAILYIRILQKKLSARDRARRQRLDYQPPAAPVPVVAPRPVSRTRARPRPVSPAGRGGTAKTPGLQQSLTDLAERYSLDSFTIATSDGLIFATHGGDTAIEDAVRYNRKIFQKTRTAPAGITLFYLDFKHSELTGIIRAAGGMSGETKKRIEEDTKDILNRWI
jgi:hypothetical protein